MDFKNDLFCITVKETEKIVTVNTNNLEYMKHCDLSKDIHCIKEASKIERNSNESPKKITVSKEILYHLDEWLRRLVQNIEKSNPSETLESITEIFRLLRNCTSDLATQEYIIEKTNILDSVDNTFSKLVELDISNICLKVLLQFLINLMSSNNKAGQKIYDMFYERIKNCLKLNIYTYEISALIYYISLTRPINDIEVTSRVLDLYSSNLENEFVIFYLDDRIQSDNFWNEYKHLKTENIITILEIIKNKQVQKKSFNLPSIAIHILVEDFIENASGIFLMSQKEEDRLKAYEVALLLETVSSLSSNENYLNVLQNNKDILINAGVLLINIHRLGKASENCFTPVQKLNEFRENSVLNEHPAFGFKADLVRLIGNLCWKNRTMQDLARTAELIPVMLDCCNMDARNPFIIQWSILAVRNLCENNVENQKMIAGLHLEGTVNSEVLNEMGITLHNDGDTELKVISFESLKKK